MKKLLFILTGFISVSFVFAQDCKMYFPADEGTQIEITNYDKKDKVVGSSVQKIADKETSGDDVTLTVSQETFDKKGEKIMEGDFTVSCHDGKFYMDMRNFLDSEAMAAYKDMEVEVDATDMVFPSEMSVGDKLPDASITVTINSSGMTMFTMKVWVTNRMVEAREQITTSAGTFDCLKMSYDTETKMMIKVQSKAVQWIAEGVGMVRSESYNKNGKLEGYSVLTALKN
ncbi:MAG: hypothetical protein KQI35_02530 [Bacteroidetes bacterium]|nr:hypothetical protein [Bacteroidota bacterium]